ncbi:hypothetical protein CANMA_004306 [Candida margitis]|uniref:uncharacterized protein n=1 Tax=Candida margitis TaxID=1775924 RepID=UPI00222646BE|nr:uncharacterized protein CANMA_004306 [Candida margitis]KAI5958152.1 hypothetical protein CANMA_004306 [Candida margitis]
MAGLFNRRKRPDSYQGFSKYTHEINTFHHPTQHAGLPLQLHQQQQQHQQQQRTQSMTTAGAAAAAAALRLHSTPIKQQQQPTSPTQRQYGRSNSLSSTNRSNSLRQYTYHPKASYQTGGGGGASSTNDQGLPRRYNSLTSQSRNSLTGRSQANQRQLQQPLHRDTFHEVEEENQHRVHHVNEDEEEVDYVVTTTTTKVVDSQGRTQSVTTKTVKTFPDGSNIIETATKNISRSNSRANSLSSNNYRNNSITASASHQPINLTKIDEDLQNFDYDYQVDSLDGGGRLKLNTGEQQHPQGRNIIAEEEEEEEEQSPEAQLGAPFTEFARPEKPRQYSNDRTSSLNSQNRPLRSILKSQNPLHEAQQQYSQQHSQDASLDAPPALPAIATAAAATAAPQVAREDIHSSSSDAHHPYKHLTSNTQEQQTPQHSQQPAKPTIATSPTYNNNTSFNRQPRQQQISSPRENVHYSHSPGSSIKFDDKVETIPVERGNYAQPTSPKQYQTRSKQTHPGPPSSAAGAPVASSLQQPNADFYAAAMQAAYKKVYGDRDPATSPNQTATVSPTSPDFHPSSPSQQTPPQIERRHSGRKSKFGFIPLTPRKEASSPQQGQQFEPPVHPNSNNQERTSSMNSLIKNKIQRDQKAQAAMSKGSVPVNYEYINHHKQFPMHSMREDPQKQKEEQRLAKEQTKEQKQAAKEQAKEDRIRAKEQAEEEKRLAKEQAEQEKRLAKEQAEQEKIAAKEAKKREKKPLFGIFNKKNRRQSQSSVYSGTSSNVGVSSPQQQQQLPQQQQQQNQGRTSVSDRGTHATGIGSGAPITGGAAATGIAGSSSEYNVGGISNDGVTDKPTGVAPQPNVDTRVSSVSDAPTRPIQYAETSNHGDNVARGSPSTVPYGKHKAVPTDFPAKESDATYGANAIGESQTHEGRTPVQISSPVNVQRLGPNIEAETDNLQNELEHNKGGRYGVNGEGITGSGPTAAGETVSPVAISSPVRVERLGPNIEAEADDITNKLEHNTDASGRDSVVEQQRGNTLDPRAQATATNDADTTEPKGLNIYSKEDAAAAPVVIPSIKAIDKSPSIYNADEELDDGQSYKISVPRKHSQQENDFESRDQVQPEPATSGYADKSANNKVPADSYYPSPNLSTKQRNSVYDHGETNEGQSFSRVPVPELNEIHDEDEHDTRDLEDVTVVEETRKQAPVQEEPSLNSYEKIPTPTNNENEKYQVIDNDEVAGDNNDNRVGDEVKSDTDSEPVVIDTLTEPVGSNIDQDLHYKTPQVEAEPAFANEATRQHSEVGASAFVMNDKLSDPHHHENLVSENFAGSQFVKKSNSQQDSPSSRGLQGQTRTAYVSDEIPRAEIASDRQQGSNELQQPQPPQQQQSQPQPQQQWPQEATNGYSSSAEPSGDTLPTTQSKHAVDQEQYNPDLEGVLVEEKQGKGKKNKKEKKEKKEKKPSRFKEKMLKYFVSGYEN